MGDWAFATRAVRDTRSVSAGAAVIPCSVRAGASRASLGVTSLRAGAVRVGRAVTYSQDSLGIVATYVAASEPVLQTQSLNGSCPVYYSKQMSLMNLMDLTDRC